MSNSTIVVLLLGTALVLPALGFRNLPTTEVDTGIITRSELASLAPSFRGHNFVQNTRAIICKRAHFLYTIEFNMILMHQCCQVYGFIRILRIYELNTDLRTDKNAYLYFHGFLQDATYTYTMVQVTHCHNARHVRPLQVVYRFLVRASPRIGAGGWVLSLLHYAY